MTQALARVHTEPGLMAKLREHLQHPALMPPLRGEACQKLLKLSLHVVVVVVVVRGAGRKPGASLYSRKRLSLSLLQCGS